MHGFFIPGFPKLMRFQDHHDKILKKLSPRLKKHLDRNEIFASLYTLKWFFQCFLDRTPFPLTLRIWDIYILEGERVLTCMAFTTLRIHKHELKKMDMDGIVRFLQEKLAQNFGFDDDLVIEQLKINMGELKRSGLDLPPAAGPEETPKLPFGLKVKPTFAQETGLRSPVAVKSSEGDKKKKSFRGSKRK
uniref:Rab-GAP TBC domain-containing protein n=1 Tax=Ciona savignyi TaxID=51511 RepID=H2YCL4_CIOSA